MSATTRDAALAAQLRYRKRRFAARSEAQPSGDRTGASVSGTTRDAALAAQLRYRKRRIAARSEA